VRSAFLQGLLLMPPETRPARFDRWQSIFQRWDAYLAQSGGDALAACLRFTMSNPAIARVVVGVETAAQLREIIAASKRALLPPPPPDLYTDEPDLILPSRWNGP
jgi:hypothetical protein